MYGSHLRRGERIPTIISARIDQEETQGYKVSPRESIVSHLAFCCVFYQAQDAGAQIKGERMNNQRGKTQHFNLMKFSKVKLSMSLECYINMVRSLLSFGNKPQELSLDILG